MIIRTFIPLFLLSYPITLYASPVNHGTSEEITISWDDITIETWHNHLLSSDHGHHNELEHAVANDPVDVFELLRQHHLKDVAPDFPSGFEEGSHTPKGTWGNVINNQQCRPGKIIDVKSLKDIKDAIHYARKHRMTLRTAGSGHSFSNVVSVHEHRGVLLTAHGMKKTLEISRESLKNPDDGKLLYSVESGIRIRDLNKRLVEEGLALTNMGAYDGQTLAGAISTGTHGSGITLGPLANAIRSLTMVNQRGEVLQIEPKDGITDPENFKTRDGAILIQDNEYFNSAMVAMGCLGVIYSYTIEVEPLYYLTETRKGTTWEKVKEKLAVVEPGHQFPALIEENRHIEIIINPYAVHGHHKASKIIRNKVHTTMHKKSGSRGILNWFSDKIAHVHRSTRLLVRFMNKFPHSGCHIINRALDTLKNDGYTDKYYKVLTLGAVNEQVKALAVELHFDAQNTIAAVDMVIRIFEQAAEERGWYLGAPLGVRFIAPSPAFIAPESGRYTCSVELLMMVGISNGFELLRYVTEVALQQDPTVRVHWGLDLDAFGADDFNEERYPERERFMKVYRELNGDGMFNSPFTDRLGISIE